MKKSWILIASIGFIFACNSSDDNELNSNQSTIEEPQVKKEPTTIEEAEMVIRADKNWVEEINKKATERGVTFEEMLKTDAEWILNEQKKNSPEGQINQLITKIKSDSSWMVLINKKALEGGVTVEEMVKIDAEGIYNDKIKKEFEASK